MLAGLADRIQQTTEADIFHAGEIRFGELDAIRHLEIVCAEDHDFVTELIQVLSVGRDFETGAAVVSRVRILVLAGNVGRPHDLLLLQINHGVLGLADLIAIVQLVHFRSHRIKQLVLRIRHTAVKTVAFGRRIEHKTVDHFVRGDIENFDATMIVGSHIDLLAILRETHAGRKARVEMDPVDDLPLRFIEHDDGVGIRSQKQRGCGSDGRKKRKYRKY